MISAAPPAGLEPIWVGPTFPQVTRSSVLLTCSNAFPTIAHTGAYVGIMEHTYFTTMER